METCNPCAAPCALTALGKDENGDPFNETWNYPAVVGILMYLAINSRPDIAYSINQYPKCTHEPNDSHDVAVKYALRYLKGTKDKGMIIAPSNTCNVDCYVDADFGGLWGSENDQDPISVKAPYWFHHHVYGPFLIMDIKVTIANCIMYDGSRVSCSISFHA